MATRERKSRTPGAGRARVVQTIARLKTMLADFENRLQRLDEKAAAKPHPTLSKHERTLAKMREEYLALSETALRLIASQKGILWEDYDGRRDLIVDEIIERVIRG